MAKYRQVYISFWQDPYIEELKPLEKYFYLYLITNSKTKQCGCYEISMKLIKYETGLSQEQINKFINLFQSNKKIFYDEKNSEFLIVNWLKHNSFRSPKVLKCVSNELVDIKTERFFLFIGYILENGTSIDSLSRAIDTYILTPDSGFQTTNSGLQQEQEQEQEQENIPDSDESGTEEFYLSKKNKKLTGKRLKTFNEFWDVFNHKQGKSDAADSWLDIPSLTDVLVKEILSAAKVEADNRQVLIEKGSTPKWAQGWITSRRWEDEVPSSGKKNVVSPKPEKTIDELTQISIDLRSLEAKKNIENKTGGGNND